MKDWICYMYRDDERDETRMSRWRRMCQAYYSYRRTTLLAARSHYHVPLRTCTSLAGVIRYQCMPSCQDPAQPQSTHYGDRQQVSGRPDHCLHRDLTSARTLRLSFSSSLSLFLFLSLPHPHATLTLIRPALSLCHSHAR